VYKSWHANKFGAATLILRCSLPLFYDFPATLAQLYDNVILLSREQYCLKVSFFLVPCKLSDARSLRLLYSTTFETTTFDPRSILLPNCKHCRRLPLLHFIPQSQRRKVVLIRVRNFLCRKIRQVNNKVVNYSENESFSLRPGADPRDVKARNWGDMLVFYFYMPVRRIHPVEYVSTVVVISRLSSSISSRQLINIARSDGKQTTRPAESTNI
jgi:hypothetical protein